MASGARRRDPVHVLLAAVREDRGCAPAVEAEHDPRAPGNGSLQLGQRLRQRDGQAGRVAGHEDTARPSCAVTRASAWPRSARPRLLFHPLPTGFAPYGPMVIYVVHVRDDRVRGEHRRREHPLQLQRVGPVRARGQAGPQSRRAGTDEPGQRPGLGPGQVLNASVVAAPSAKHALSPRAALAPAAASSPAAATTRPRPRPGRRTGAITSPPRTATVPSTRAARRPPARTRTARVPQAPPPPAAAGLRLLPRFRCRELRLFLRIRFRHGRFRPVVRQRVLHVRPAQAAQHRIVHPQPPRDLRVPHSPRPPCPRLLPRALPGFPGPPGRADNRRRTLRSARWRSVAT